MFRRLDLTRDFWQGSEFELPSARSRVEEHQGKMAAQRFKALLSMFAVVGLVIMLVTGWFAEQMTFDSTASMTTFVVITALIAILMIAVSQLDFTWWTSVLAGIMFAVSFSAAASVLVAYITDTSFVKVLFVVLVMMLGMSIDKARLFQKVTFGMLFWLTVLALFAGWWLAPDISTVAEGSLTMLDWLLVLLFGSVLYYDMIRAQRIRRSADQAIDAVICMFFDWVIVPCAHAPSIAFGKR